MWDLQELSRGRADGVITESSPGEADTAPGSPLELVRVLVDVLLGDGERLAEPQLAVFCVVPDEADRAADLVGARSEVVSGEQVVRRPDGEVAELDRVADDDVLHGTAADPADQRC